jgi:hypothetical protein
LGGGPGNSQSSFPKPASRHIRANRQSSLSRHGIPIPAFSQGFDDGSREYRGLAFAPQGFVMPDEPPTEPELPNPFTPGTNESFLESLYIDLLGRNPDEVGFNVYLGALANQTPRDEIVDSFLHSPEYFGRQVEEFYSEHLVRDADAESLAAYVASLLDGRSLEDVRKEILTSDEYSALHPTDDAFIDSLYRELLGRSAGSEDITSYAGQSRGNIVDTILHSEQFARVEIAQFYDDFLEHDADTASLDLYVATIVRGDRSLDSVLLEILASDESYILDRGA